MKKIEEECYKLSFQAENPAFILEVHRDFIEKIKEISKDDIHISFLKRKFNFDSFGKNFENHFWGFNNAFERIGDKEKFVRFLIKIPGAKMKKCSICRGSGKSNLTKEGKCPICRGKGHKFKQDFKRATAISASFTVFFMLARPYKGKNQLMEINTATGKNGVCSGNVFGTISSRLAKWLKSFRINDDITEAVLAMKTVFGYMYGLKPEEINEYSNKFTVRFSVSGELVHIGCFGNACGLSFEVLENEEYKFGGNNVDGFVQQIILLCALAVIWDLAEKKRSTLLTLNLLRDFFY